MLIDSYDAQGIKFGILMTDYLTDFYDYIFKEGYTGKINEAADELILSNKASIIDFSDFDGLTTEEVYKVMGYSFSTPIIFVVYTRFETIDSLNRNRMHEGILDKIIIRGVNNKDSLIDEDIEDIIVKNYQSYSKIGKRYANCFLQRYRYGTKEKTDKFIKQYIKK